MKYYKLTLETLSPVHIGSGDSIGKMEFVNSKKDKRVYVIDQAKLFKYLNKYALLNSYESLLNTYSKNASLDALIIDHNIDYRKVKKWAKYSYEANNIGNPKNIDLFMRDNYSCPYIPGSSVKGALRTVLLNYIISNEETLPQTRSLMEIADNKPSDMKEMLSKIGTDVEDSITHTISKRDKKDALSDCFAGLRVSDSKPLSNDDIILCQKIDRLPRGDLNKKRIINKLPIFIECLKPGTTIEFDISVDERLFKYTISDIRAAMKYMDRNICEKFLCRFFNAKSQEDTLFLGGKAGYITKTFTYSMLKRPYAVRLISAFLEGEFIEHRHNEDVHNYKVSPHTEKTTYYNNERYDIGMCRASFKEMKY